MMSELMAIAARVAIAMRFVLPGSLALGLNCGDIDLLGATEAAGI
jgi:hypothetical protein